MTLFHLIVQLEREIALKQLNQHDFVLEMPHCFPIDLPIAQQTVV